MFPIGNNKVLLFHEGFTTSDELFLCVFSDTIFKIGDNASKCYQKKSKWDGH